jgi:hypothetical protein
MTAEVSGGPDLPIYPVTRSAWIPGRVPGRPLKDLGRRNALMEIGRFTSGML